MCEICAIEHCRVHRTSLSTNELVKVLNTIRVKSLHKQEIEINRKKRKITIRKVKARRVATRPRRSLVNVICARYQVSLAVDSGDNGNDTVQTNGERVVNYLVKAPNERRDTVL